MATVTRVGADVSTTAGNKSVTGTPAVGDLIVVFALNSGRTSAQPPTISDNNSGGGGTYTRHTTGYTKNTSADSGWVFIRDAIITSASSTVFSMTQSSDTGGGLEVYRISDMTRVGTGAIRQINKQDNQAAGTPSITLSGACLTTNPALGMVHTGSTGTANTAPPTSWTEAIDAGWNTPPNGREIAFRATGNTLTTIAWTAVTPSAFGSIVIEVDASTLVTGASPTALAITTFAPDVTAASPATPYPYVAQAGYYPTQG